MAPDLVATAFLAAARKQRLLSSAQARNLRPRILSAGIRSAKDLKTWLPGRSGLPPEQIAPLTRLLPPADERVFAPYEAIAHPASGGMGQIWLAASAAGSLVVVKTLAAHVRSALSGAVSRDADGEVWIDDAAPVASDSPGTDPVARLERETRITRSLDHANIVRCLDHGLGRDGQMFLVLEFMKDGDLKDLLEDYGPLPEPVALSIARQVAAALEAAHRQQVLHRDVKPGNIFLAADGHAKLADFGFARSNRANHTQLTMAGSVLGSPLYMAPEQVTADAALDVRCDLYGLGCVLYHCLAGTPPYNGGMTQVLRAHCVAAIPDVRRGRPEISATTAALVTRLLQKDPSSRPPDPTAAKLAIIEAMAGVHLRPDQKVPLPRKDGRDDDGDDDGGRTASGRLRSSTTVDLDLQAAARAVEQAGKAASTPPSTPRPTVVPQPPAPTPAVAAPRPTEREPTGWSVESREEPTLHMPPPAPRAQAMAPAAPSQAGSGVRAPAAVGWAGDWLTLTGTGEVQLCLWARTRLVAGKLRGTGVDLCLRNYPEEQHREACTRISRAHLALTLDGASATVEDLGSANGTVCDGQPLAARSPLALEAGRDHLVEVSRTVVLRVRAVTGGDGRFDALVIGRPANRPGLAYALVHRGITVGGNGCDVRIPGATGRVEIGRRDGAWYHRGSDGS